MVGCGSLQSKSGLLLLANAKKNAIYAIHLEYGSNHAATCMNYINEFTVIVPILSFTGTSELLHGEHVVRSGRWHLYEFDCCCFSLWEMGD